MTRPDFSPKTKLAMWQRAGGPDDPRCECYMVKEKDEFRHCGRQPITKSDPAEYHHIAEAEGADRQADPERWAFLKSAENGACVRRSCHKAITGSVTAPQIAKSRHQRRREAGIKKATTRPLPGSKASGWKKKLSGEVVRR